MSRQSMTTMLECGIYSPPSYLSDWMIFCNYWDSIEPDPGGG